MSAQQGTSPEQQLDPSPSGLLAAARQYYADHHGEDLDRQRLTAITQEFGCEFATAVLYEYFYRRLPHGLRPGADLPQDHSAAPHFTFMQNATLAIVPGALYLERPGVGGDGRMLRDVAEQNDWPADLVPTSGTGRVDDNAVIVRQWLARRSDRKIILVSLSKGTTDTVRAIFDSSDPMPQNIAGWVSISGIPFGTPMVNWMMERWLFRRICRFACWIRKADVRAVGDLTYCTDPASRFSGDAPFPVYHIAGFPRREHLSCRRARLWYRRFRNDGPTDSVLMLGDLMHVPGIVIPVWGADHYLKTGWDTGQTVERIMNHLVDQHRHEVGFSKAGTV